MANEMLQMIVDMMRTQRTVLPPELDHVAMRANMERMTELMALPPDVVAEPTTVGGVPAEWVSTPRADERRVVLYLHGGGYVVGSLNTHRDLAGRISRASGARVLNVDYRLAPEHPHPAAVEDATAAYRWLLQADHDPARLAIAGDSAGGGLTVATLVALRDQKQPLPAAGVCLSPWVDLEGTGESMTTRAHLDPMVQQEPLVRMGRLYLGELDPRTPLASPLHADLSGLPPLYVQVGTAETLLDDSTRIAERARKAGVDVTLDVWDDMIHVFQAFAPMLPEGQQAIDKIGEYLPRPLVVSDGRDAAGLQPGLFDSPWPAEDGGPRRQLVPRAPGLGMRMGERLVATSRPAVVANMVVLRAPGEVYLQGSTTFGPDAGAFVERIDPLTLATIARSPDLDAGGVWWPGGIVAHRNGFLYVTHGRYCHKLDAECRVVASRRLPREQAYNSLLVLSDGTLVMKNMVRDGSARSAVIVLDPERLEPVGDELEIPEGSIARISADRTPGGDVVYVVGDHTIFRVRRAAGRLVLDDWRARYVVHPDAEQSYGWDPVLAGGHAWFLDNGANTFTQSFHGGGTASGPIHLVRVSLDDARDWELFAPFGAPHGTVANPPAFEPGRRIAVAYDSGNARLAAFRFDGPGRFARLWEHGFGAGNHFLLYPDTGELVVNDFQPDAGEHVVVLDLETGAERGRIAIDSPVQSVVFQAPGFGRDLYTCTFTTVARVAVEGESHVG